MSKVIPTFVLANRLGFIRIRDKHILTADKAASLRRFYFGGFRRFAKLQGGAASLCLYIQQVFRSKMRTVSKNLKADARGVSASTPSRAKTVSETTTNYLSRGSYISIKGRLNKALAELERVKSDTAALDAFMASREFGALFTYFSENRDKLSGNLYLTALNKAYDEFLQEEACGYCYSDSRLAKKIEAAALLFPEDRKALVRSTKKSQ